MDGKSELWNFLNWLCETHYQTAGTKESLSQRETLREPLLMSDAIACNSQNHLYVNGVSEKQEGAKKGCLLLIISKPCLFCTPDNVAFIRAKLSPCILVQPELVVCYLLLCNKLAEMLEA